MSWHPTRKTLTTVMDGVHDRATGSATITLERVNGRICFKLAWAGIGRPVAAHIHHCEQGSAVLPLFVDAPKRKGCVRAPTSLINEIAACPGSYHVKLRTHRHPEGALIGQL